MQLNSISPRRLIAPLHKLHLSTVCCANADCRNHDAFWTGMLRRKEGATLNGRVWYCSPECMENGLANALDHLGTESTHPKVLHARIPLGLLMLSRGVIDAAQLRDALEVQKKTGRRIGECLCDTGAATERDVLTALGLQWACPVFPLASVEPVCAKLVPSALIEHYRMLPVHFSGATKDLYVGFCGPVNSSALYAIEQMLDCHTEPCMLAERVLSEAIEKRRGHTEHELELSRTHSGADIARIVTSYAQQLYCQHIRYVRCDGLLWVRIHGLRSSLDLTFKADQR